MKKILTGLIIGLVIALPISVLADVSVHDVAKKVQGVACSNSSYNGQVRCNIEVYKFNNGGNTCYVANGGSHGDIPAISCVRYAR